MTGQDEHIRPIGHDEDIHQPFDVQAQKGEYAMWKLLGALGFLILLALLVFFVYQPGARDRSDPVVISPTKTALKVPPPEQAEEAIKDKTIYNAGNESTNPPLTTIEPEAPIELPKTVDVVETTPSQPSRPSLSTVKPSISTTKPLPPQSQNTQTNGSYLVQVASLRSYEEAEATWNRIAAKNDFLRGQLYDIKRVDLQEKGIYYRLRIDGLSSSAQANAVCDKLKSNGQACFTVSR